MSTLAGWLVQLDDLLRGRRAGPQLLDARRPALPLRTFAPLAAILGAVYGAFMGLFLVRERGWEGAAQILSSALKLPLLFLLTLLVTFPSLYVFSALLGSRLGFSSCARVLVGGVAVNLALAASFGPILGFFTLSTDSYPFMVLLNVALLGVSGLIGCGFLLRTLRGLSAAESIEPDEPAASDFSPSESAGQASHEPAPYDPATPPPAPPISPAARERALASIRRNTPSAVSDRTSPTAIFTIWIAVYGLVGTQMGWILRPFIGSPDAPFEWFRTLEGNGFQAIFGALGRLLGIE